MSRGVGGPRSRSRRCGVQLLTVEPRLLGRPARSLVTVATQLLHAVDADARGCHPTPGAHVRLSPYARVVAVRRLLEARQEAAPNTRYALFLASSRSVYGSTSHKINSRNNFIIIIWFVRLLALRPLLAFVPASGDSEDDCGEEDGI
jgi:hypothetical protein